MDTTQKDWHSHTEKRWDTPTSRAHGPQGFHWVQSEKIWDRAARGNNDGGDGSPVPSTLDGGNGSPQSTLAAESADGGGPAADGAAASSQSSPTASQSTGTGSQRSPKPKRQVRMVVDPEFERCRAESGLRVTSEPPDWYTCFHCMQKGHFRAVCPRMRPSTRERPALCPVGEVEFREGPEEPPEREPGLLGRLQAEREELVQKAQGTRREVESREGQFKAKALRLYFAQKGGGGGGPRMSKVVKAKQYEQRLQQTRTNADGAAVVAHVPTIDTAKPRTATPAAAWVWNAQTALTEADLSPKPGQPPLITPGAGTPALGAAGGEQLVAVDLDGRLQRAGTAAGGAAAAVAGGEEEDGGADKASPRSSQASPQASPRSLASSVAASSLQGFDQQSQRPGTTAFTDAYLDLVTDPSYAEKIATRGPPRSAAGAWASAAGARGHQSMPEQLSRIKASRCGRVWRAGRAPRSKALPFCCAFTVFLAI
eukprot:SAG22_NODE_120_length_19227_cov_7.584013_11_plen_483_part_00